MNIYDDGDVEMSEKQYNLLLSIKEALEASPYYEPSYEEYEEGYISRETYYNRCAQYNLVGEIKQLLQN